MHNCARILQFALNYDINQLKESTKLYIIDHIKPVSEVNLEFNELPADLMIDVVQHPAAVICTGNPAENEKQLFALLWRKITSLPEEAQTEYILKLLKAVHLPVIRDDYLKLIEKKVSHVEGTRDVLEEARKTVDVRESREWYLPRYKSSSSIDLKVALRDTPLEIADKHTKMYSPYILINGLFLSVYFVSHFGYKCKFLVYIGGSMVSEKPRHLYKITISFNNEVCSTYYKGKIEPQVLHTFENDVKVVVQFNKP